jgi:hypothetical protein
MHLRPPLAASAVCAGGLYLRSIARLGQAANPVLLSRLPYILTLLPPPHTKRPQSRTTGSLCLVAKFLVRSLVGRYYEFRSHIVTEL